jgi:hypothetical protein
METSYPTGGETVALFTGCFALIIGLAIAVFFVMVHCKIFSKAGYHWAMGLLMLVPIANLIVLCILAFGQWPIHREMEALRRSTMAPPPDGQPHESFRGV